MIKRFLVAFVLLAIVAGGLVGFNLFRDKAITDFFANMPRPVLTVSTVDVELRRWTPDIQAIGTVNAARGVDLTVETTGVVQEVLFKANDKVKAGDMLLRLDRSVQQADLEAAEAQAALDAQLRDRAVELKRRGVSSETTVDSAQAAATASASQVQKLKAVLDQKQLIAPFDGTIGIPRVDPGQYLAPGDTVTTLQDLDTMRADFSVPEQELPHLRIGQPVRFGLSTGDLAYSGRLTGIEPKVDPQTRLVALRAEIDNPDGRLSPGQFVQVRVVLPEEDDIVALPQTAVVASLYGDYVYAVVPAGNGEGAGKSAQAGEDGEAEAKLVVRQLFVKTGRRTGGLVEILDGVKPGDRVVTAGQNRLNNGSSVKVDNTVNPAVLGGQQAETQ